MDYNDLRDELLQYPEVREAYDSLKPEYDLIRLLIKTQIQLNLTQDWRHALDKTKSYFPAG